MISFSTITFLKINACKKQKKKTKITTFFEEKKRETGVDWVLFSYLMNCY